MQWGIAIGWINTILLGVLGIAVLATRRWRHLKWLPVYAIVVCCLTVIQGLWLFTHEFSFPKRIVCSLLHLGAVCEILRKEADKRPVWRGLTLLGLVVIPFLPLS